MCSDYNSLYQQSKQALSLHFPSIDIDLSGRRITTALGNGSDANLHDDRKVNADARDDVQQMCYFFFLFSV